MKLNPQLAQALVNLKSTHDFQIFMAALGDEGEKHMHRLIAMPESDEVSVVRGETRAYVAVMDAITNAPSFLQKLKETPRA